MKGKTKKTKSKVITTSRKVGKKISRKKALEISQDILKNAEEERKPAPELTGKTDEELKQIAKDLWAGKIFSSAHINRQEDLPLVFMALVFLSHEQLDEMEKQDVNFFYEYMSEATPTGVNGMPTFFSVRMLKKPETIKMLEYYEKFKAMVDTL